MKKQILIIAIAFLGFAATAQDTIKIDFDFKTYILTDTVYRGNGSKVLNEVNLLPFQFTQNQVAFNYLITRYNASNPDSVFQVGRPSREQVVLNENEMNAIVVGRRVWEWLQMYYRDGFPQGIKPETLTKELGELVYYYKVEGGN